MSCSSRAFDSLSVFSPFLHDSSTRIFLYRLGTTANNAGSQENFTKIDKEYVEPSFDTPSSSPPFFFFLFLLPSLISYDFFRYVVNAAKAAKADKDQRLIYVSVRSSFEPVGFTAHMS